MHRLFFPYVAFICIWILKALPSDKLSSRFQICFIVSNSVSTSCALRCSLTEWPFLWTQISLNCTFVILLQGNREEIGLLEHQEWITHKADDLPVSYDTSVFQSWNLESGVPAGSKEIIQLKVWGRDPALVIISTVVGYSSPGSFSFTNIWKIFQSSYDFLHF